MTNPEDDIYERILLEQESKEIQYRLVVSKFRGVEYIHIRKYYLDFEGVYMPTKEGVAWPFELTSLSNLFEALVELLSLAESKGTIEKHFKELLGDIYEQ
jgi:hypothetical protein